MSSSDPNSSTTQDHTPSREFITGARDTIPLLVGALPFGMIYGTLAITAGISKAAAMGMSAMVFAGSAQFIAVGLIGAGTPVLIIIATTFIVNLRHLLYSTTLLPYLKKLPLLWRMPLAFCLTDETFAVSVHRWTAKDPSQNKHWYQLGSSLAMYLNWQFWCFMGLLLGESLPKASEWGLDVAMPVTFIGMTIPFVKSMPMLVCILSASFSALLFNGLPYKAGLMIACALGILAGLISERLQRLSRTGKRT